MIAGAQVIAEGGGLVKDASVPPEIQTATKLSMAGHEKRQRNLTQRWTIIGERPEMLRELPMNMLLQPVKLHCLKGETIST